MTAPDLTDSYGRAIGDLRISVTDRCNFRCTYCIPVENIEWKPKDQILSYEEIVRVVRVAARFGIRKIRLTGGEPLLRPGLTHLIRELSSIDGIDDLALTTNGKLLASMAHELRAAGLKRLNVSLDSLQEAKFQRMTKRNALGDVLEGIEAAGRAGFERIRVNAVIIRGVNDDEILDFARFAREHGHSVRFIEFMPLDSGHFWTREQVVSGSEILQQLRNAFPLVDVQPGHRAETARRYGFADAPGEIGVIAPVTAPFCGNCNRLRLTADGQLRTCLFSMREHDLRAVLRTSTDDAAISNFLTTAVLMKEAGHRINEPKFVAPERSMSCIGG
jgi:cyclic pyranopterin phosphate synthase